MLRTRSHMIQVPQLFYQLWYPHTSTLERFFSTEWTVCHLLLLFMIIYLNYSRGKRERRMSAVSTIVFTVFMSYRRLSCYICKGVFHAMVPAVDEGLTPYRGCICFAYGAAYYVLLTLTMVIEIWGWTDSKTIRKDFTFILHFTKYFYRKIKKGRGCMCLRKVLTFGQKLIVQLLMLELFVGFRNILRKPEESVRLLVYIFWLPPFTGYVMNYSSVPQLQLQNQR